MPLAPDDMIADFTACYEVEPAARHAYVEASRHRTRRSGVADGGRLDPLAKRLAKDYLAGTADFDFCATIMRHLMWTTRGQDWPPFFWDVHIAFDAGEFHHAIDPTTVERCELHTRPMLAAILKRSKARPTSELRP